MKLHRNLFTSLLSAALLSSLPFAVARAQTPIPTEITTPDEVQTRLSTSKTKAFWERPVVYLSACKAEWPERGAKHAKGAKRWDDEVKVNHTWRDSRCSQ
jgi:hypothetical protein